MHCCMAAGLVSTVSYVTWTVSMIGALSQSGKGETDPAWTPRRGSMN